MSTGLTCFFIERSKGQWYYLLERANAPRNAYDWRDYADAYGPFNSLEKASEDLENNHSNPGEHTLITFDHYSALSEGQKGPYEDLMNHPSCPITLLSFPPHGC